MSDTDSFIEEVNEEVRRDRFFVLMKKYGWIAIALVLLLVGGAAYNEWNKARTRAAAEKLGDTVLTALQNNDPAARVVMLQGISAKGDSAAMLAMLTATEALVAEAPEKAKDTLRGIATDENMPSIYRHLAELKLIMIEGDDLPPADRIARLEPLTAAGAPYRLLAEEQTAVAEVASGDKAAAIGRLQDILADGEVTSGLRRRVSQLIVALGGELDAA